MAGTLVLPLWAVHISDGILTFPWLAGGSVLAALLAAWGAWRIQDEEIPQVAVLTAAFFVASLIHVRLGPTSVHLLLNGLVGIVLGRRAALAIPVGLFLQAALLQHGGFTALGVNACVMTLPALLAWQLFAAFQRVPWTRRPWFQIGLIAFSVLVWLLSLVYSLALLYTNHLSQVEALQTAQATAFTFSPLTVASAALVAAAAAWASRRLDTTPEFPVGLLVGEVAVLATLLLNALALLGGGEEDWHAIVLLVFVAHLPVAAIEGVVLGFTVSFLARVKPEMLRWSAPEKAECSADALP